jgi:hypothetical protein
MRNEGLQPQAMKKSSIKLIPRGATIRGTPLKVMEGVVPGRARVKESSRQGEGEAASTSE